METSRRHWVGSVHPMGVCITDVDTRSITPDSMNSRQLPLFRRDSWLAVLAGTVMGGSGLCG